VNLEDTARFMAQDPVLVASEVMRLVKDADAERLARDQMAHQLSVTIAERDAERALSDALQSATLALYAARDVSRYDPSYPLAVDALNAHAKARGQK
jgi:hypothetical protein